MNRLLLIALLAVACSPPPGPPDGGSGGGGGGTSGGAGGGVGGGAGGGRESFDASVCSPAQLLTDPSNCGTCGHVCEFPHAAGLCVDGGCAMGACQFGFHDFDAGAPGCETACVPTSPATESCDGLDNDCNGTVDDGVDVTSDPMNCGACGARCVLPAAGAGCQASRCVVSGCDAGFADLDDAGVNGCEYRCPVSPPITELCNGVDDDCDGVIDDSPSDVGGPCSDACPSPAPCVASGTCSAPLSTCVGGCCGRCTVGTLVCQGAKVCSPGMGPAVETCNGVDDDCDGQIDQGFDTRNDPRNCGGCGNACVLANAIAGCANSACTVVVCQPGYANRDNLPGNGCEYTCPVNPPAAESCNGLDDDCNGAVDDGLITPANFCVQTSICFGSRPVCSGTLGWKCNYAAVNTNIEVTDAGELAIAESLCDGLDGNCNTQIDESFPNKGRTCSVGTGLCTGTSTFACAANKLSTVCPAVANPTAAIDELCNGVDDDCDGQIDERVPLSGLTCFNGGAHSCLGLIEPMVRVGNVWVHQYEASHPDATAAAVGGSTVRACSKPNVLPWAPVNQTQAAAACAAIRNSAGNPMRLCTAPEWTTSCNLGVTTQSVWSFAANPTVYANTTCNGYDNARNAAWPTGTGASCYANNTNGRIYDLSGNVAEWTSTSVVVNNTTYFKVRGGAYNNFSTATNCNFDFTIQQATYQFNDLGFRCCSDAAP